MSCGDLPNRVCSYQIQSLNAANSIRWLDIQDKTASPQNMDLTRLRFAWLYPKLDCLYKHINTPMGWRNLLSGRTDYSDWFTGNLGNGKYWCWGRMPLRGTVCVCVCLHEYTYMYASVWGFVHICGCSCLSVCVPSLLPNTMMSVWPVNNNNNKKNPF